MYILGISFAIIALVCWGFGDYFIQRTSRDYGVWPSLFCISGIGAIILLPFAIKDFNSIFNNQELPLLLAVSFITYIVSMIQFRALKLGKISVIEPIMSFELPLTVFLSVILLNEQLIPIQMFLVMVVFGGILLVGYTGGFQSKHLLEKGALLALLSTVFMATMNFTTGLASQAVGPVATIWFIHTFIAIVCVLYFSVTKKWHHFVKDIRAHPLESILVALFDNGAWLAYASAVVFIPISLAITISESYIILAILLGVFLNKEKLLKHQWVGVVVSLGAVIFLSTIS